MRIKQLAFITSIIGLFSMNTNASIISLQQCSVAFDAVTSTIGNEISSNEIIKAYAAKGYIASEISNYNQNLANFDFVAKAFVDCNSTYYGIASQTEINLFQESTNKFITGSKTPLTMEMFFCKIELLRAISLLPTCSEMK
ncbi:MAG: hypothetical protein Q7U04_11445 [Bacteriovorax sp.]|nr:hypothetical protein [Bacteriovorax sp.]